ncbi:MAG: carboxypeptidase-like regulatory domain-containing protein, partial [Sphingomonadales bacterium]|nr:carboxypeptidase-like regulatory domain-containing protein [Sphingomonadales bacterium]
MSHRSLILLSCKTFWFAILLGVAHVLYSNNTSAKETEEPPRKIPRYILSGYLRGQNGENLLGATVKVEGSGLGTASNTYGYYALTLDSGTHVLSVQYLGYKTIRQTITLVASKQINFTLQETSIQAAEVVVVGRREDANVTQGRMSVSEVDIKQVKSLPVLMGEADILKTIQLL